MNNNKIHDNDLDVFENEYENTERIRETHPYFLRHSDEREAYMDRYRASYEKMSTDDKKKARLMYKRLELLAMETSNYLDYEFLYKIGFLETSYRHWHQGRYTPTKQQIDTIAAYYNVTPEYFETGILPYISICK